ncbi:bifunctional serine/threonine-protein kinase/formylglycine-generating enzyme family protein [Fimbriiglobus ruber]|uniref:non-specific serine/threonine protein kinase n=1 Tax=Fimbriiglobus ruber TaxID=1908690 RepID=A0A225E0Q9_9BACT|nr:bifunctional serine/threonine-protein kinase/formylglycine-generating enzyme family protein [Fimbriiglobus ruber]OWK43586.1 Serine/threonine protein kinase PrkC, regulator of stationary phase [Fimbriiglobus ruber]
MQDDAHLFSSDKPSSAVIAPHNPLTKRTSVISGYGHTKSSDEEVPEEFLSPPRPTQTLKLGHFDVLETIGQGGFGVVVKAFDQRLLRIVAIKLMTAEGSTSPARKRFVREARAAAAVRHENVVQVYAVEEQPTPHLVMEYVPGGSLQQLLDRTGPLDVRETLRIGAQIAQGLAAAHAIGLVHRDIKPANVLLEKGDRPQAKLTDFGLARAADDASLTQSGFVLGTPMYMSPEQARGDQLDHRADIYSLGSVLYVMLTGRPPFRALNTLAVLKRVAEDKPRPIQEIIPEVPSWLCDIISKLHAKNPAERFQSASEVAEVLSTCLTELQQGRPVRLTATKQPRRKIVATAAVCAVAIGLVGLAGFAINQPNGHGAQNSSGVGDVANPADTTVAQSTEVQTPLTPTSNAGRIKPKGKYTNRFGMEFVKIPAGTSVLSGTNEYPNPKSVTFSSDFYLGTFEVTQEEWDRIFGPGHNPSRYSRNGTQKSAVVNVPDDALKRFPVDGLSWEMCQEFLKQLNRQDPQSGWVYRLPLSNEWEYACRGGPGRTHEELALNFHLTSDSHVLRPDQANFSASGLNRPCPVGSYDPNRLGLYDMHGNVFEICEDVVVQRDGTYCPMRGGFWHDSAVNCQAKTRNGAGITWCIDGAGMRVALVPKGPVGRP